MITNKKDQTASLSRRNFLRSSGLGLALLATGGVSTLIGGCSLTQPTAPGFQWLRPGDLPFLRAVTKSVLKGSIQPDQDSLNRYLLHLDAALSGLHPISRQELFDLINL
ncbi:MAG: twin-arginine translocation signal domain-containing protein, partial [Endozoicomonas sp.]